MSPRTRSGLRAVPLLLLALLPVVISACGGNSSVPAASAGATISASQEPKLDPAKPVSIVVGVPKNFGYFNSLYARNVQVPGVNIEYKYFPVFTDMIAALNAGQIDLTEVGDVGAFTSKANGSDVVVVGTTEPNPKNIGLLVPKDSDIKSFADLKGKKVIFLKTTNTYTWVLKALKENGLTENDIQIAQISGPDANKAFETGQVDAYFSIDPNLADVVERTGARIIADGSGYNENLYVYTATRKALQEKPQAIRAVLQETANTAAFVKSNPDEHAKTLSPKIAFTESAIKTGYARGGTKLVPIDDSFKAKEKAVIDTYVSAGILKQPVDVNELFTTQFSDTVTAKP